MAFVFPSTIRDLERDTVGDDSRLCARSPIDITAATPSDLEELVKGLLSSPALSLPLFFSSFCNYIIRKFVLIRVCCRCWVE